MVVFLDLEDEAEPPEHWLLNNAGVLRTLDLGDPREKVDVDEERDNPNKQKAVTKALGCYPYVLPRHLRNLVFSIADTELTGCSTSG